MVEESSWSSTAVYSHEAAVQTETAVFEQGAVLEDQPAYLSSVAPVLNGTFQYGYNASDSGDLSVAVDQTLVVRAVGDEGTFEFWREETDLGSERVSSLQPGERAAVPFSLNVTDTRLRIEEIESQLDGSTGDTEIIVQSNVTISGQRNGVAVNETNGYQIRIDDQGTAYRVGNDEPVTDSDQQFRPETVTASYGPLRSLLAPALFVLSAIGLAGLVAGRRQGRFELSEAEREWLRYRAEADEFEEWLSTGTIPDEALSRTTVRVETLEDLVDLAIDSNRRVVRDHSRGLCAVLLEETVYTYDLPEQSGEEQLHSPGESSSEPETQHETGADDGSSTDSDEQSSA
ncbi:MAG: DUF5305 domain-containing protein [Halovenus sp.]|uniref:DUF5305 domain-containing protein n=1 Tax=Halovenus amylolytica TaxID=2500550 RepID=UPI000FE2B2F0